MLRQETMTDPLQAAHDAARQVVVQGTSCVSYRSEGKLLLIGSAEQVLEIMPRLTTLQITVLLCPSATTQQRRQLTATASVLSVQNPVDFKLGGHFGAFALHIADQEPLRFDLVLDLCEQQAFSQEVLPIGFYAPRDDARKLQDCLGELPEMHGQFDKPKYFVLDNERCAHCRSGIIGCQRCLDACPAGAIQSRDGQISVDPYLCQGCGDCSSVCPAGAISYNYPNRQDALSRLFSMLRAFFAAGGSRPVILLHDREQAPEMTASSPVSFPAGIDCGSGHGGLAGGAGPWRPGRADTGRHGLCWRPDPLDGTLGSVLCTGWRVADAACHLCRGRRQA